MLTFAFIGVLALVLTIISFRWYNLLLSFVACLAWLALWAYNLSYPMTGVTSNSFIGDAINFLLVLLAIVTMLIYFRNRGKAAGSFNASSSDEGVRPQLSNSQTRNLMDLDTNEYKAYLKARRTNRK
jgi:hypothetical protein